MQVRRGLLCAHAGLPLGLQRELPDIVPRGRGVPYRVLHSYWGVHCGMLLWHHSLGRGFGLHERTRGGVVNVAAVMDPCGENSWTG